MSYDNLDRDQLVEALREMEKRVKMAEEEKSELEKKAKKVKADFENYKKREQDRKESWKKKSQMELSEDLIEVLDNLERAIASADEEKGIVQGVKMVADQLYEELEQRGLERIDAEGEEFDPRFHKAVDTEEHEDDNRVLRQKRAGYKFDDEVLREAEVVVSESEN